jgi:hypothetical protein
MNEWHFLVLGTYTIDIRHQKDWLVTVIVTLNCRKYDLASVVGLG